MADNIQRALVTGPLPVFINGVLHLPSEVAYANLDELGVKSLDDDTVVGLEKVTKSAEEPIVETPIAAVAPHAPDAPNPQGLPTGTKQSGTGRLVLETSGLGPMQGASAVVPAKGKNDEPAAIQPVGADKPGVPGEQTPQKPSKGK